MDSADEQTEALKAKCIQLLNDGRTDMARLELVSVVNRAPDDPNAWYLLGMAHGLLGAHTDAASCFYKAIDLQENYPDAHLNLGNALLQQHRYAEAEEAYRTVLRLTPQQPAAYFNLGHLFVTCRQYDRAVKCFGAALRMSPTPMVADTMKDLGRELMKEGLCDDAKALFNHLCTTRPDDIPAWRSLARVNARLGDAREAARCCQQIAALEPDDTQAHVDLGHAHISLGNTDEGMAAYARAIAMDPGLLAAVRRVATAVGASDGASAEGGAASSPALEEHLRALMAGGLTEAQRRSVLLLVDADGAAWA